MVKYDKRLKWWRSRSRKGGGGEKLGREDCGVKRQGGGEQAIPIRQKLDKGKTSDHFAFLGPLAPWMSLRSHP